MIHLMSAADFGPDHGSRIVCTCMRRHAAQCAAQSLQMSSSPGKAGMCAAGVSPAEFNWVSSRVVLVWFVCCAVELGGEAGRRGGGGPGCGTQLAMSSASGMACMRGRSRPPVSSSQSVTIST